MFFHSKAQQKHFSSHKISGLVSFSLEERELNVSCELHQIVKLTRSKHLIFYHPFHTYTESPGEIKYRHDFATLQAYLIFILLVKYDLLLIYNTRFLPWADVKPMQNDLVRIMQCMFALYPQTSKSIDCLMGCTACLVCFISTVNGRIKKRKEEKRSLGSLALVVGT